MAESVAVKVVCPGKYFGVQYHVGQKVINPPNYLLTWAKEGVKKHGNLICKIWSKEDEKKHQEAQAGKGAGNTPVDTSKKYTLNELKKPGAFSNKKLIELAAALKVEGKLDEMKREDLMNAILKAQEAQEAQAGKGAGEENKE